MNKITTALAALTATLSVIIPAASLTPATVIVAMLLVGAAGAFASLALFTEDTTADGTDEVLMADETPADNFDATGYLLDMMEATAAAINPDDVDLFIYRPAIDGATEWTATLHDTYNDAVVMVIGDTESPQAVSVNNYDRKTGESDYRAAVAPIHIAREFERDLPNIYAA